jgi:secreted trypsin-like serine protease
MKNLPLSKILLLFLIGIFFGQAKEFKCDTKLSCGCSKTNVEFSEHIVNSEQSIPYSWSMIVSIQYDFLNDGNSYTHICEGTILTDSFILTSANCVEKILKYVKENKISILTDISQRSKIDEIFIHPKWNSSFNQYENDIALLHLSQPLTSITRTCLSIQKNTFEELIKYPSIKAPLPLKIESPP